MAISHSSGIERTRNSSVGIDRLRIDFDSNLRRWFGRNIGLWHSRRQYFFDGANATNLEMYINISKLIQNDSGFESYRFNWWCEDEKDFFIKRPTYKSEGEIITHLQGHQLIRNCSYLSDSSCKSNIRQVDEHELIFESNYDNWHVLEHTRLIDRDKFRSRNIYSWHKDKLKIVIVRDMWLTGFDVPSLHTMYVDKPMRGHGLMQAIARVNRIFKDKPAGLVVDYIGIAQNLKQALSQYSDSDKENAGIDEKVAINVMLEKFDIVKNMFHGFDYLSGLKGSTGERLQMLAQAMNFILKI